MVPAGWEITWVAFYNELKTLVNEVADRADRWTGQSAWTFEVDSPASAEVANTELRLDGSPWGERPVRTAYARTRRWRRS
jgi:hypothetical protein